MRAISDLKNGLPIYADTKHNIAQTASKKFYFAQEYIDPCILHDLKDFTILSTQERKKYGNDDFDFKIGDAHEQCILDLLKVVETLPLLVCTLHLPKAFAKLDIIKVKREDVIDFTKNFIYDLRLITRTNISLKEAKVAEFFVFRTPVFGREHYVIKIGHPEKDNIPLVRIHSSCYTGDLLASLRCDCRDQLQDTIHFISNNKEYNGGYILYVMQEGRGIGLANKIRTYELQIEKGYDTVDSNLCLGFKDDERSFMPAKKMLDFFKIDTICLITNNPKKQNDIENFGIKVAKMLHTIYNPNAYNAEYLDIKHKKMGHEFKNLLT